jgi:geranylgeranyl reductase family protein
MNIDNIKTDILIIGAGPSGCMAADILLDAGKDVLLIDKYTFPRHKPCAGGLTPKTVDALPFEIDSLKQHDSQKMIFKFTNGKAVDLNHATGACKMVIREDFDNYFFKHVKNKGAKFINDKIISIKELDDKVYVKTTNHNIHCNLLIGADGANSTVRRLSTHTNFKNPVFAFEGLVDKKMCKNKIPTKFIFNKLGYAWIFPKSEHYNIGIGNLVYDPSQPKPRKKDLFSLAKKELGTDVVRDITGFPIGTEGLDYIPCSQKIYLVGDAAGLAETLLGEGIYNAVISAKYLASAIVSSKTNKDVFNKYIEFLTGMKQELSLYNRASKILYRRQRISYWMLKLFFGKRFMDGYSEGKTLSEIIKGKYPFPTT